MRILFVTRHFGCLRNFETAIASLAARGHCLHLVALNDDILGGLPMVQRWAQAEPRITFERLHAAAEDRDRADLIERVHLMVDYLRYLDPAYRDAGGLVERARRRTPRGLVAALDRPWVRSRPVRAALGWVLRELEAATPRPADIDEFVSARQADITLFTPLIGLGSGEQAYLAASRQLGLRTVFCVWSWDNLSSKSIIRTMPDAVTVWNDIQRHEAVHLHGVPADRVVVTGAQSFDHWFDRQPARTRAQFAASVGLPPASPFLLWVCSALFKGSPVEAEFVRRWIEAIRSSPDPLLRDIPILVRPHPSRLKEWNSVALEGLGPVSLWGANPIDPDAKADYFDSLYFSAGVVGLNTSAFLEAAIVGRPVFTVLLPEYRDNQEGTLHFPYLLEVAGGLLHAARSLESHLDDLLRALRKPETSSARSRDFVGAFIRPHGLDVRGTDRFVEAVERVGHQPAPASGKRATLLTPLFRSGLSWLEPRAGHGAVKEWLMSPTEYEEACRRRDRLAADRTEREQRLTERRSRREERLRLDQTARAERARLKQEALDRHREEKRARKPQSAAGR